MKFTVVAITSLFLCSCAFLNPAPKRTVEVVATCFNSSDNQLGLCKAKRLDESGNLVTTRCVGLKNQVADPKLRGKCVEKTCTAGPNAACSTRGVLAVLDQFADQSTAQLFVDESAAKPSAQRILKPIDVKVEEPALPPPIVQKSKKVKKPKAELAEVESAPLQLVLRPAKKSRTIASVNVVRTTEDGFKRFCTSKTEMGVPKHLRGKCAVRTCTQGKCSYQGHKEIVDWASQSASTL